MAPLLLAAFRVGESHLEYRDRFPKPMCNPLKNLTQAVTAYQVRTYRLEDISQVLRSRLAYGLHTHYPVRVSPDHGDRGPGSNVGSIGLPGL